MPAWGVEATRMKMSDLLAFLAKPSDFDLTYEGKAINYLNEAGGAAGEDSCFFVAGFEFGPSTLVHVESFRGDGFEAAYEAWIDDMPVVADEELVEAYTPATNNNYDSFYDLACNEIEAPAVNYPWEEYRAKRLVRAKELMSAAFDAAHEQTGEYPELVEGYVHNSSGGVVDVGHYAQMHEADLDQIEIVRKCGHEDCAQHPELAVACRAAQ
jgi:hypothetical protein